MRCAVHRLAWELPYRHWELGNPHHQNKYGNRRILQRDRALHIRIDLGGGGVDENY